MKMRIPFSNPRYWCALVLLTVMVTLVPPKACAQGPQGGGSILDDLGNSKNGPEDIANSLVPGPKKYGHGETKEQINAAQLKTKSINDSTFGGSLLNSGLTGAEPKLDAPKTLPAPAGKESSVSKHSATAENQGGDSKQSGESKQGFTFSNLSQTATLSEQLEESAPGVPAASEKTSKGTSSSTSTSRSDDSQKKDQTTETHPAASDEKASTHATPKTSPTKSAGDH
jgi:hypothetical protein